MGLAADEDVSAGYEFLKSTGQFDEVSVGRSWSNSAALQYVFRDEYIIPATPQLIVLEREVEKYGVGLKVHREIILLRLTGNGEVTKWIAKNIPLAQTKTYKGLMIE